MTAGGGQFHRNILVYLANFYQKSAFFSNDNNDIPIALKIGQYYINVYKTLYPR